MIQSPLAFTEVTQEEIQGSYKEKLIRLLRSDLSFQGQNTNYGPHNFHAFPAKFPPQLPGLFISQLTESNDLVVDPMMGSGTTVLEAALAGRRAYGFDIDPLALLIARVKINPLETEEVRRVGREVISGAKSSLMTHPEKLLKKIQEQYDEKTLKFFDHWFAKETQIELQALAESIKGIENHTIRAFLELTFSAIIITKSGGVSMAFDLAHTRPHRAKIVKDGSGKIILGHELVDNPSPRTELLTKTLRSPLREFENRLLQNVANLLEVDITRPALSLADAQKLPLDNDIVDLIVTSPPYASNAIDYMRAHKFSLTWLGYSIGELSEVRKTCIGGESIKDFDFERLPDKTRSIVADIASVDEKKGTVLHRYYSEMTKSLREYYRVLKPGKAAILVVGCSVMRGKSSETHLCLADIGKSIGFEVPAIGVRQLDRNRRMLPASWVVDQESQIQQRMHEEYVISFYKPKS